MTTEREELTAYRAAYTGAIRGLQERIETLQDKVIFWRTMALGMVVACVIVTILRKP